MVNFEVEFEKCLIRPQGLRKRRKLHRRSHTGVKNEFRPGRRLIIVLTRDDLAELGMDVGAHGGLREVFYKTKLSLYSGSLNNSLRNPGTPV